MLADTLFPRGVDMSNLLHVCLYNTDPKSSKELQEHITSLNFARFLGEVGNSEDLARALGSTEVNVIFFHLDPKPEPVLEVIDQVATRYPTIALIAVSHQSDVNAVLAPMRAGCDQFVCEPIDPTDLSNAVARVASRRLARSTKSRVICVAAPSGGSGATSIACNLALEIGHLSDRECGLLDLDTQFGDVATNFDSEPRYTLHDLADSGDHLDRSILASTVTALPCKVALVARPEMVEHDETLTPEVIHRIVELMSSAYENVVIDLPGHINPKTLAALHQADLILVVSQLIVPSIRNAKRYFDALARSGIPEDRLEYVVNRVDGRGGRVTIKDVEEAVKKPVYGSIPNDYQFVAKSIDLGRPIAAVDSNSPVRVAIRKVAQKILTTTTAPDLAGEQARRGFLSRFLTK